MTHNLSIMVDVDEPLFPFMARSHEISIAAGIAEPDSPVPTVWNPYLEYGCTKEQWWEALRGATYDGSLYSGDPEPGAVQALWRLEHAGHALHLVTARGTHDSLDEELRGLIQAATVRWLAEHFVPYDSLTFSRDKTVVPADFGIDDNLDNYDALARAGVAVWLIDRPWNQDRPNGARRRVNSLTDFADLILTPATKEAIPA